MARIEAQRIRVCRFTSFLQKAGFRVVSAQSAEDALAALERAGEASQLISLLVTDLDMPGMSGRSFAAGLMAQRPDLKVLYVTSDAGLLFQQGRELGANEAFLEKPVSAPALREAVNLLLRPPRLTG